MWRSTSTFLWRERWWSLATHDWGGEEMEFRGGGHGGLDFRKWKGRRWRRWRKVERKWDEERESESVSYVKMRWVVRFMQVGVGLVRVIRSWWVVKDGISCQRRYFYVVEGGYVWGLVMVREGRVF